MSRSILITGGTGFVGRQVLRALAGADVSLRAVVRNADRLNAAAKVDVLTTSDLFAESPQWWERACLGIDTIVHIAWYVEPGKYLTSPKNLDCLLGTLQMVKGAVAAGVRRIVGVGTCFEYDLYTGVLSTDTPLKPNTPYAAAKAAAFMTASQWLPLHEIQFAWCRLFYLYGDGEDQRRLVPYVRSQLAAGNTADLTSGTQIRDFLDVSAAGELIASAALSDVQGPINICSGVPITVRQLAESIADQYNRRDLLRFGARPDNLIDPPCVVGIRSKII